METVRDGDGKEIEKRSYEVTEFYHMGQGYPLFSNKLDNAERKKQFVRWPFTPVFEKGSPAVAGIIHMVEHRKVFRFGVDTSIGNPSWSWPEDVPSKQKPVSFEQFDPENQLFKRGAHAPLMVYLGASRDCRRSGKAVIARAKAADRRGWDYNRRQSTKSECKSSGAKKGEGKSSGSKQKGKGKGRKGAKKGEGKSSGSMWLISPPAVAGISAGN